MGQTRMAGRLSQESKVTVEHALELRFEAEAEAVAKAEDAVVDAEVEIEDQ